MSLVIGVLSGKGGVGKTTLVSNLGASLAKDFNKKTVIVDGNVSASHLGLHLNLYEDLKFTLKDVLDKKLPVQQAIYIHPPTGLRLLPAPLSVDSIDLEKIGRVIDKLSQEYEIVIVDTAPGLGKEVLTVANNLDFGIVVTTPDLPSVTDALKTIKILSKIDVEIIAVVLNRVNGEKYELDKNEIESMCGYPCSLVIPEDKSVPESIAKGVPVVIGKPYSKASIAIKKLAAALVGSQYEPKNFVYQIKKFFGMVKEENPRINLNIINRRKRKFTLSDTKTEKPEKELLSIKELQKELRKDIKEELKKELMKRLKKKLAEREL